MGLVIVFFFLKKKKKKKGGGAICLRGLASWNRPDNKIKRGSHQASMLPAGWRLHSTFTATKLGVILQHEKDEKMLGRALARNRRKRWNEICKKLK